MTTSYQNQGSQFHSIDFFKYQSLGNDCILMDCYDNGKPLPELSQREARHLCDRHFGVGADAVIVIGKSCTSGFPFIQVFNADGSRAEICLNGLRCAADFLFQTYNFPSSFYIQAGSRRVACTVCEAKGIRSIRTGVGQVEYLGQKEVAISEGIFVGHIASVGNPHCIFFQKKSVEWLQAHGYEFESHPLFPERTNVEFVSSIGDETSHVYDVLVYERGCGMTLACGSGASAIVGVLNALGEVRLEQQISIRMQGGELSAYIDRQGSVILEAPAFCIFKGVFNV